MYRKAEKLLAVLLCVCMLMTMNILPSRAFAEGDDSGSTQTTVTKDVKSETASADKNAGSEADAADKNEGSEGNAADNDEGSKAKPEERIMLAAEGEDNGEGNEPAGGNDSGALTMENHTFEWTGASNYYTIENGKLTITPYNNQDVQAKAKVTFSCGGNEGIDTGKAVIKVPRYIYFDRDGNPIGDLVMSIPEAPATGGSTSFNYTVDDNGTPDDLSDDMIVIKNYEPIEPGGFFMKADIVWKANPIEVKDGYSKEGISASFSAQGTNGGNELTANEGGLSTTLDTKVKVNSANKNQIAKKERWQSEWGPEPADADDYFYVVWTLAGSYISYEQSAPFDIYFIEQTDGQGEVAAWSTYPSLVSPGSSGNAPTPYGTGLATDFKTGTTKEMNEEIVAVKDTRTAINAAYGSSYARTVVMKYPRTMVADGATPKITNKFTVQFKSRDGEISEKVALKDYIYQQVGLDPGYGGDTFSMYKRQRAGMTSSTGKTPYTFNGMLNLLRNGASGVADWSIDVKNYSWDRTEKGTKEYETVLRDGMMYVGGQRLLPGDYQLEKFYPAQYDSIIAMYNEDLGYFLGPSPFYDKDYPPIKVEVKDKDGNWSEYGSITKVGDQQYKWQDMDGKEDTRTFSAGQSNNNSDNAIMLPAGTQDIRFTHSGKTYGVEFRMGLYYRLFPSEHLMSIVDENVDSFNLININEAWGQQENKDGEMEIYTGGNEFNNTSTPTIKADVEASDTAEFGGTKVVAHDFAEHKFSDYKGTALYSKTFTTPYNFPDKQYAQVGVNVYAGGQYDIGRLGITVEEAIAAKLLPEVHDAYFYDLLPPGADVNLSSIIVRPYSTSKNIDGKNAPIIPYTLEMHENWRGSGRTMMIVHATTPDGYTNYQYSTSKYLNTGFKLEYAMIETWDNLEANGTKVQNDVAFVNSDGSIPKGVTDTGEGSTDKALLGDLIDDEQQGDVKENVAYATASTSIVVPTAAQMGFSKKVKGAGDNGYSYESKIPAGGNYNYLMRFALSPGNQAKGVVMYDVLETAYDDNPYWQGTFRNVDVTQIEKNYPDTDVKVYYSTSKEFGDLQATSGIDYTDLTNETLWTTVMPDDPSKVTAVAVDMSKDKDGKTVVYEGEMSAIAKVNMKAPDEYKDKIDNPETKDVDETKYAYNQAYVKEDGQKAEKSETTKVELEKSKVTINKSSNPRSGSEIAPTSVVVGNTIDYTLIIKNSNIADAITDVKVEDVIPDGLEIDKDNVSCYFNYQSAYKKTIAEEKRVDADIDGQKMTFNIDKLAGGESVILTIPVKVLDQTENTKFVNQAEITEFNDTPQDEYESEKTYHELVNTSITLPVKKVITGQTRPVKKTFTFTLTGKNDAPMPSGTGNVKTVTEGVDLNTAFDKITYNKPGDYEYTVAETDSGEKGYTYDSTVHNITVHVTEENGKLKAAWEDAQAAEGDSKITFTNNYKPIETSATLSVKKLVGGDTVPDNHLEDFEFTLSPVTAGDPMPAAGGEKAVVRQVKNSDTDKQTSFGAITFTKAGTYKYNVKETIKTKNGYVYDASTHVYSVIVVDNDGQLEATWVEDGVTGGTTVFENDYKPEADVISFNVKKNITGNDRVSNFKKEFKFKLESVSYTGDWDFAGRNEALPMPTVSGTSIVDEGTGTIGQIAIEHAGVYKYKITETATNAAGYTYDSNACNITVNAVDTGGKIDASNITYAMVDKNGQAVAGAATDKAEFTNDYTPQAAETRLAINKQVKGDTPDNKPFNFKIEGEGAAPMPADDENPDQTDIVSITGSGTAASGLITFTEAGTYKYKVTEVKANDKGYTYSSDVYNVTCEVTDNDGVLEVEKTITKAGEDQNSISFVNTYKAEEAVFYPAVSKEITGSDRPADQLRDFTFTLTGKGDAPMPEGEGNKATVTDVDDANFGPITFTKEGTYEYTITEDGGSAHGYTYSKEKYTLTITVTDNNGTLTATHQYKDAADAAQNKAVFTNNYEPTATMAEIPVEKTITGNDRPQNNLKDFEFVLEGKGEAPMPDEAGQKAEITDSGKATFGAIEYIAAGTYKYTVKETAGNETGYKYSKEVYNVTVTVTDNNGFLESVITYDKAGTAADKALFTNEYEPTATAATIPVQKIITGSARPEGKEKTFEFNLKAKDNAPMPEAGGEKATVEGEGTADFGEITYSKAGTYKYEISEKAGNAAGYTYSKDVYEATVTVTDEDGTLGSEITYKKDGNAADKAVFTNNYEPTATAATIPVQKIITGSARPEGKEKTFEFNLKAKDNAPMPEAGGEKATVEGEGTADFGEITYKKDGTYKYEISEKAGNAAGYTYSKDVYEATVTVTDEDGVLTNSITYTKGGKTADKAVFTNEYKPDTAIVTLPVQKGIKGDKPSKDETFSFKLKAKAGAPVPKADTVKIDGEGKAEFGEITYNKAGTYEYSVSEVKGNAKGYTYDNTVYTVKVTVTDDDGVLIAEWKANDKKTDSLKFINKYKDNENANDKYNNDDEDGDDSEGSSSSTDINKDKNGKDKTGGSDKNGSSNTTRTGDSSDMTLWFALAALAAASLIASISVRGRRRKE